MNTWTIPKRLAYFLVAGGLACTGSTPLGPTDSDSSTSTTTGGETSTTTTTTTTTTTSTTTSSTTGVEPCINDAPLCLRLGGIALAGRRIGALAPLSADNDGYSGLVAATDKGLYLLANPGDGTLVEQAIKDSEGVWGALAVGDLNGDGEDDIVAARNAKMGETTAAIVVFLGTAGDFKLTTTIEQVKASGLALADINGDSALDVLASLSADGVLEIRHGDGKGGLLQASTLASGLAPTLLTASALDSDPVDDIAIINTGSATLGTSLVVDGKLSEVVTYALPGTPRALTATSLDGFMQNLLVTSESLNQLSIYTAKSNGSLSIPTVYDLAATPRGVVAADFTGDSKIDVSIALPGQNTVSFWLNKGDGTLYHYTTYAVSTDPSTLVALRINDDARVDLAIGSDGLEGGVHLLLSDP